MATPSPYRAPPQRDDVPRSLSFFPQLRPWFVPVVMVVGALALYLPSIDPGYRLIAVGCELTFLNQRSSSAQSAAPGRKPGEEDAVASCWTCAGKCTHRQSRDSETGKPNESWRHLDCAAARRQVERFGKEDPTVFVLSPGPGMVSSEDVRARFDRCVGANGKTRSALAASTDGLTVSRLESRQSQFQWLAAIATLLALVLCLPTRRVRVTVDRQSRMVRVRERGLFRDPRLQEFAIDELLDVTLDGDAGPTAGQIILRRTQGLPLCLVDDDLRPTELRQWTAKRLGAWLAAARARD
jgi:hypothetical protein